MPTGTSATLIFTGGSTTECVTFTPLDDDLLEADTVIDVSLSSPTGGANLADPSMATVVIIDNDGERHYSHCYQLFISHHPLYVVTTCILIWCLLLNWPREMGVELMYTYT